MTVKLRGHHLLCMITYEGVGYSEAFARNFEAVIDRIRSREGIEIVDGPDDICRALICDPAVPDPHCQLRRVYRRDRLALAAVGERLGRPVGAGSRIDLTAEALDSLRSAFKDGTLRKACRKCEWEDTCTGAGGDDFSRSLLEFRNPQHRRG